MNESAQQAITVEVEAEFVRIEGLVEMRRKAARSAQAGKADIAKAKLIEDFINLQKCIELLPERERLAAQQRLSALESQL